MVHPRGGPPHAARPCMQAASCPTATAYQAVAARSGPSGAVKPSAPQQVKQLLTSANLELCVDV